MKSTTRNILEALLKTRDDMPQVKKSNMAEIVKLLKGKVGMSVGYMELKKLHPSQTNFIEEKITSMREEYKELMDLRSIKPLMISQDNYIIDGHHRWKAGLEERGGSEKVPVLKIDLKQEKALPLITRINKLLDNR